MQACPHCQSINPDNNRFCQKCGGALAEACLPDSLLPNSPLPNGNPDSADLEVTSVPSPTTVHRYALLSGTVDRLAAHHFLDRQQRYQMIADLPTANLEDLIETLVIDLQPLQPPFLDEFSDQRTSSPSISPPEQSQTLPAAAQPYLELQKQYPLLPLPKIHDAWEQEGLSVVLLEERSHFPSLLSVWGGQALLVEIIDWLNAMIEFWIVLQPQHYGSSLLRLDNLRIDDNGLLCLQRLYEDGEQSAELTDLGVTWQTLFSQSQRTQRGDIAQLFYDVQFGIVASIADLRSRLTTIQEAASDSDAPSLELPTIPALMNLGTLPDWDDDLDDSQELTRSIS
ncbi:MAG: hypothetical protein LH679_19335, partial [Cyanobacteria bacterium CAN_BIN43]|nr:hypothetical protein [Cyanobacteria bacterium CAN_BIN43]